MLTGYYVTTGYRISSPSGRTDADRVVINHATLSVSAASSRTRILALEVDTGLWWSALRVGGTLRPALGRNTEISREARACRNIAYLATLTVGSARCRDTRPLHHVWLRNGYKSCNINQILVKTVHYQNHHQNTIAFILYSNITWNIDFTLSTFKFVKLSSCYSPNFLSIKKIKDVQNE